MKHKVIKCCGNINIKRRAVKTGPDGCLQRGEKKGRAMLAIVDNPSKASAFGRVEKECVCVFVRGVGGFVMSKLWKLGDKKNNST